MNISFRRFVRTVCFINGIVFIATGLVHAQVEVECIPFDSEAAVARWERGTVRRMDYFAVNNSSSVIVAGGWDPRPPSNLTSFLTDVTEDVDRRPVPSVEIFEGVPLSIADYQPMYSQNSSDMYVQSSGGASPGATGSLQRYDIDIAVDAPLGEFDFSLFNWGFSDPQEDGIVSTILYQRSFRIMPKKGDVNGDGIIDGNDIAEFVADLLGDDGTAPTELFSGEYSDWSGNDDGRLDGADIQQFVIYVIAGS